MKKVYIPKFLESDDRADVYNIFSMIILSDLIIPFQASKDKEYQSHWAHRGLLGYKDGCIMRQVDRIEPGIANLLASCDFDDNGNFIPSESSTLAAASLLDTLVDAAVYSLLGVCLVSAKFPQAGAAYRQKLLHRALNGADRADTDLDLYNLEEPAEFAKLAEQLAAKIRAELKQAKP